MQGGDRMPERPRQLALSCADYTWPAVSHGVALDLVAALGFSAVDLGLMHGRSHLKPEEIGTDVEFWAGRVRESCESRGLAVADVFYQAPDFETMSVNHPDPAEVERGRPAYERALRLASLVGSPGVTILPGVSYDGDTWEQAVDRAADELGKRVSLAGESGLRLSVEPHVGSIVDTPERALALLARVPGLTVTLDYGHFSYAGFTDEQIEPLTAHAGHVQCRGATNGALQASMRTSTIDFGRMVAALRSHDYAGYLACEYVWADWLGCNLVDNLTETVALRDVLREAVGA
ncbi:MAG: TIM barrel protein [Streptosporangiales bacterium]|nr:TIM barrel protein [Streptosporangiales bacterium]